ncbi:MFS transporter [Streptomyces sp. 549]|uniref:CynX/NimT family MFS transporter n=1 Tax=Streptomyces sp. 549 TaxID=3049076 RepID=UPI0024C401CE|nr:MFS transporter [Streptomyces sp. 549]MDK1474987.1 MFS transporter [Streptomyces sp. 549]
MSTARPDSLDSLTAPQPPADGPASGPAALTAPALVSAAPASVSAPSPPASPRGGVGAVGAGVGAGAVRALRRGPRGNHPALLLAALVLAALNMRAALAGVSPLLGGISAHFGLTATGSSLITTIPLVFMGLVSPLAPRLARRYGTETVLLGALVLLAAGNLLRIAPPALALFGGCAVVGGAIALLNVLMPGLVKRDFPDHAAGMTALYTTAMIAGATVSAAVAVPLEDLLGGWQGSLVSWSLPALVAALAWLPHAALARRTRRAAPAAAPPAPGPRLTRSGLAWQVTLFMGLQSTVAYVTIAWLPTIYIDHGMARGAAGLMLAFSTLVQMAGSFLVPLIAGRLSSQRLLAVAVVALMASGVTGLLVSPVEAAWLWAALLGVGQGGTVGLALTMIVLRSGDAHTAARLSGMAQTWGYLLAAAGPLALGALHQLTGGWTLPLALLLALCAVLGLLGMGAGRNRRIGH